MKMYTINRITTDLASVVAQETGLETNQVAIIAPKEGVNADLCLPCFALAKFLGSDPKEYAATLAEKLQDKLPSTITSAEASGGYLNFKFNWPVFADLVFGEVASGSTYGHTEVGKGKTIVVDLSSPNIAKPFSVGHLRSTVIGDAIVRHFRAQSYTVIGDNHLGDWGTSFGKLIVAYQKWGDHDEIQKAENPVLALKDLYVHFHEVVKGEGSKEETPETPLDEEQVEAESADHPLMIEARQAFLKLEQGDPEMLELWKWFVELSMKQFAKTYALLGFKSDEALGESFYEDKMAEVVEMLEKLGYLVTEPSGAKIIQLDDHGIVLRNYPKGTTAKTPGVKEVPLMLLKQDGATVYATRDLAAALYRQRRWHPAKIVYVVGQTQELYFKQIIPVMSWLGVTAEVKHVGFGTVLITDPKTGKAEMMSTRAGKVILLEEVLAESVRGARKVLDSSKHELDPEVRDRTSQLVGVGAVKFADLGQNRSGDIIFDWTKMLNLNGYSGPYLQYMAVRAKSVLAKVATSGPPDASTLGENEWPLFELIARFPQVIERVCKKYEPHHMAQYLFELASAFSSYYDGTRIIDPDTLPELQNTRLHLVQAVGQVLEEGLRLLGIETPEKM